MKKFVALLLAAVMLVGMLAGCNTEKPVEDTKPVQTQGGNQPAETQGQEEKPIHPVTTDPVTITILTQRHTGTTNNAEDIWFFNYMEWWLHETYGYNVTLEVQQTAEPEQQISLLLGTDTLPDIVWGIPLTTTQAVIFGDGQDMLLDWSEYMNEDYMPVLTETLSSEFRKDALAANTAPSGAVYSVPFLSGRGWNKAASSLGGSQDRMFINTAWLEEFDLKMPTNIDEFLDMLRTFRDNKVLESGEEVIPLMSNRDYLEKALWTMHGYYGSQLSKYGTELAIKNGQVELPVYTEDYKSVIRLMRTMYEEGLLSKDYFTMDVTTMRGLTKAGVAGAVSDSTMADLDDFTKWECMPWFTIGDTEQVAISCNNNYRVGTLWASSATEYPEIVSLIVDYIYSEEGAALYNYGPMKGQDPLEVLDGWYYDENGTMTCDLVANGTFSSYTTYCYEYVYPYSYVGRTDIAGEGAKKMAGVEIPVPEYSIMDTILGEEFTATETTVYSHDNASGHWFLSNSAVSRPHITTLNLPAAYLSEEDALRASELASVLNNHITSESAKFITGTRPLEELDTFMDELKQMGIEEYIGMYREAYSDFMALYFG